MPGNQQYYPGPPGSVLYDARISAGKTVLETAEALNLLNSYVEALENNDYSRFNSPLFARGYIKSYARYMGLDEVPLLKDCDRICRREEESKEQKPARLQSQARAPGNAGLISALLLTLFIWCLSVWIYGGTPEPELSVTVLPERMAPLTSIHSEPSLGEVLLGGDSDTAKAEDKIQPVDGDGKLAALEFEFSESVWVELRDVQNQLVLSGVQEKGEKLDLQVQGPVTISMAYWPAVVSRYNGRKVELNALVNSNAVRVQVGEL
ncbi:helix-turn-helix domain-containing protein [Zhongshania guokunii]|uniref:Helix-turn-helix domain-containing protein n=1 Tax=Zhongshania guokunii TaxID=641783 RepID=A0ABV3U0S0_9GAMM